MPVGSANAPVDIYLSNIFLCANVSTRKRVEQPRVRVPSHWRKGGIGCQPFAFLFLLIVLLAAFAQSACTGSPSSQVPSKPISHSVTLDWTASTSAVIGYNVYRGTRDGGPYAPLNSSLVTTIQYEDSQVQSGQTYYYVVTAVDSNNVESENSNQVSATIPSP